MSPTSEKEVASLRESDMNTSTTRAAVSEEYGCFAGRCDFAALGRIIGQLFPSLLVFWSSVDIAAHPLTPASSKNLFPRKASAAERNGYSDPEGRRLDLGSLAHAAHEFGNGLAAVAILEAGAKRQNLISPSTRSGRPRDVIDEETVLLKSSSVPRSGP